MATVNFILKGIREYSPIYVRFIHTRAFDFSKKLEITVNPKFWDKRNQKIRNVIQVNNRDFINMKLYELRLHLIDSFNKDYIQGEIIDKNWFSNQVDVFFKRPIGETKFKIKEEEVYLSSFAKHWLEEYAPKYKVKANKYMGDNLIKTYKNGLELFENFEGINKVKLKDISGDILDNYSMFLIENKYSPTTTSRLISRIKFFCARAEELNLDVNKNYKQRVYVEKEEIQYKKPYLNIDEITQIFNLEIEDQSLDAIRDNFIIGLWTGLRISDLHRLSLDNIKNGIIEIKTKKTNHNVAVPLHPQVIHTLNKRLGALPSKYSDAYFNKSIKKICEEAGINKIQIGSKMYSHTNTVTGETQIVKKIGHYPKFELVSSHICRRSFATNHFGKVPNNIIMDVCGWKSEKQMLEYNKQTNIESAMKLKEYWNEMSELEKNNV